MTLNLRDTTLPCNITNISLMVGLLCIGLINACFSHVGFRHWWTVPFSLDTITPLLHHLISLSNPSGAIICFYCNLFIFLMALKVNMAYNLVCFGWYCTFHDL